MDNNEKRDQVIEATLEAFQEQLEHMSYEELLGGDYLDGLLEAEIEKRMEAERERLEELEDGLLLGNKYSE